MHIAEEKIPQEKAPSIKLPKSVQKALTDIGNITRFGIRGARETFRPPFETTEFLRQCFEIGYGSILLVCITGFIMGLVLTIQSRPTLAEFGAESWLPGMVSISIFREIGPVVTALICAGKIGSRIGAELGSMRVTEQIDAMEVSATNPIKYLAVTRVLACTLMVPVLVLVSNAVAIGGSYLGANIRGDITVQLFIDQAFYALEFTDVIPATIKTFFFGYSIGLVGCFKGYHAQDGTEGVGNAANSAVVVASLCIFILDMIAVQLTDLLTEGDF